MENIVTSTPLGEGIGLEVAFVCAGRMVDAVAEAQLLAPAGGRRGNELFANFQGCYNTPSWNTHTHTPKPTSVTQQAICQSGRGRGLPSLVGNLGTGPPFVRDIC